MIDKHLTGIQLLADKEQKDKFSYALNIKSIPRFLLIDSEGKIIDANAKRPSDPRLKTKLKEIVKKPND
ncbi:MAG: hypothetical protein J7L96_02440 [Bacteroidales bacterium]|nr:hypothetical protein [Bacteroidales bacterium]